MKQALGTSIARRIPAREEAARVLGEGGDAEMTFTLWAHDEGIELAQANCAKFMAAVEEIEDR